MKAYAIDKENLVTAIAASIMEHSGYSLEDPKMYVNNDIEQELKPVYMERFKNAVDEAEQIINDNLICTK